MVISLQTHDWNIKRCLVDHNRLAKRSLLECFQRFKDKSRAPPAFQGFVGRFLLRTSAGSRICHHSNYFRKGGYFENSESKMYGSERFIPI